MALEQTVTIVNNSGKIISTGKHLASIFKEAKASYQEKKSQIKSQRSLQRAQTFDHSHLKSEKAPEYASQRDRERGITAQHNDDYGYDYGHRATTHRSHGERRRSLDGRSVTSSKRSHRSKATRSKHHGEHGTHGRPALTESNLELNARKEASSAAGSRRTPPVSYRSPYAETIPLEMGLSRMDLNHVEQRWDGPVDSAVARRRSEGELGIIRQPEYEIDMDLAYGNIPPDLESRIDLDPARQEEYRELRARQLVQKVEGLLDEAHCLQHSASGAITHLQKNPDAAAAVALTLAELSSAVSKVSPAILGLLKGNSPAVFSLLASPQFLIGSSIVVGVTVVIFGGWKIIQKMKEQQNAREAMAFRGMPPAANRAAPLRTQSEFTGSMDEALVIEQELSAIETWRRGISPSEGAESVEMELITPKADRAAREHQSRTKLPRDETDTKSRKSSKTVKTHKSHKSSKSKHDEERGRSSRHATAETVISEAATKKTHKKRERTPVRAIEDGRNKRDDDMKLALRPRAQRQGSNMLKMLPKDKQGNKTESHRGSQLVLV